MRPFLFVFNMAASPYKMQNCSMLQAWLPNPFVASLILLQISLYNLLQNSLFPQLLNIKLSLFLTNEALPQEGTWGRGCIDPPFLDLALIWKWVVGIMSRPLYPWGKSPQYPLDRRLGESQNWSGWLGEEKKILDSSETWTSTSQSSSQ
jgi:hypothetical protein